MEVNLARRSVLLLIAGAAKAQNRKSLFDGRSADGWISVTGKEFPSHCWKIDDGCLVPTVVKPTFQDIRTIEEFGDFEFSFEWNIAPGGNCGVKYLIEKFDVWTPAGAALPHARGRGPEYQLTDDALSAESMRDATKGTASLYGKLAPLDTSRRPAGQWNESKIVVRRPRIEHWLNGVRVLEAAAPNAVERSPIVLRNHSSECRFRSLRIVT